MIYLVLYWVYSSLAMYRITRPKDSVERLLCFSVGPLFYPTHVLAKLGR